MTDDHDRRKQSIEDAMIRRAEEKYMPGTQNIEAYQKRLSNLERDLAVALAQNVSLRSALEYVGSHEHECDDAGSPKCSVCAAVDKALSSPPPLRELLKPVMVAIKSSGEAWKKMSDGLDRVKQEGETSVEIGCEVASTFRLHQSGCEDALTRLTALMGKGEHNAQ